MDSFERHGRWWLPGSDRGVAGELRHDRDGLELTLHEPLEADVDGFEILERQGGPGNEAAVVFGRTIDGVELTVLGASHGTLVGSVEHPGVRYIPSFALIGCHAAADSVRRLHLQFDYLAAWTDPPPFVEHPKSRTDPTLVRFEQSELDRITTDECTLRLLHGAEGHAGGPSVRLDQYVALDIELNEPIAIEDVIRSWVRPVQDFLIVCLGRPVRLTQLSVWPEEVAGSEVSGEVRHTLVQTSGENAIRDVTSYYAPTLIRRTHLDSGQECAAIARWVDFYREHQDIVIKLTAPYHVDFTFIEHRFGSTFLAAEAYHRRWMDSKQLEKTDHAHRVNWVIDAARAQSVDEEVVTWAAAVLQARNDKTMVEKMKELLEAGGAVGTAIQMGFPRFAAEVVSARNGVSHPRSRTRLSGAELYPRLETLRWLLRLLLLAKVGLDQQLLAQRVLDNGSFQGVVRQKHV